MENLFWIIIKNSIAAGGVALLLALLRMIFRKAPRRMFVMLWGLVAIRLLLPFSFETRFGLMPDFGGDNIRTESAAGGPEQEASNQTVSEAAVQHPEKAAADASAAQTGAAAQTGGIATGQSAAEHGGSIMLQQKARKSDTDWMGIASVVWLGGVALMLLYAAADYVRLRFRVREAIRFKGNIWRSDRISTPFILGLLRPRIYLPSGLDETDRIYVVAHERMHQRRRDPLRKMTGFVLLSFFWFQPLIWLAYVLFCRDIEYACDEAVLERIGKDGKKPYAEALINCSTMHRPHVVSPLSFAEASVKRRIVNVLRYRKAPTWMTCLLVAFGLLLSGCFMTERKAEEPTAAETSAQENVPVDAASLSKESATEAIEKAQKIEAEMLNEETEPDTKKQARAEEELSETMETPAAGELSGETTEAATLEKQPRGEEPEDTSESETESLDRPASETETAQTEPQTQASEEQETTDEPETAETTEATETTEAKEEQQNNKVVKIEEEIPNPEEGFTEVLDLFWEENGYQYFFPCGRPYRDYVIVTYADGHKEPVVEALEAGRIHIGDLKTYYSSGIWYEEEKQEERTEPGKLTLEGISTAIEDFFDSEYEGCSINNITFIKYLNPGYLMEVELKTSDEGAIPNGLERNTVEYVTVTAMRDNEDLSHWEIVLN